MINAFDYERSAKLAYLQEPQATLLAQGLADTRQSLEARADLLAGTTCPATVGQVIAMLGIRAYPAARCFLPALHTHQIALWFEGH